MNTNGQSGGADQNTGRIIRNIARPPTELIARFRAVRREIVADCVAESGIVDAGLMPLLDKPWSIAGPAVTVGLGAPDILLAAAATAVARDGDVIVVTAQGRTDRAVWGGGLSLAALSRNVAGVVIDGAVRGTPALLGYDLPVFCRGRQARSAPCVGSGSVNVPIICGGVTVYPGDIVLGDLDGVIVVPLKDAVDLIATCERLDQGLAKRAQRIKAGETSFFDDIQGNELLESAGIVWDEGDSPWL